MVHSPYTVSMETAMLAHSVDTETDIAIRQGGKRGAKLKDSERLVRRFEKSFQQREQERVKKDAELVRRYEQRVADMASETIHRKDPAPAGES